MDPLLLRGAFRIAFLVLAAALVSLPFQPEGSAERVVTALAALVGLTFTIGIAFAARAADPPPPRDTNAGTLYNGRAKRKGR